MSQLALTGHGGRQFKPVFQDLSFRRWYGFLALVGSAAATAVFLSAILWYSVQTTPQLPLLDAGLPALATAAPLQSELAPVALEPQAPTLQTASGPISSSVPDAGLSLALLSVPHAEAGREPATRSGDAAPPVRIDNLAFAKGSFVVLGGGGNSGSTVYIGGTGGRDGPERTQ